MSEPSKARTPCVSNYRNLVGTCRKLRQGNATAEQTWTPDGVAGDPRGRPITAQGSSFTAEQLTLRKIIPELA